MGQTHISRRGNEIQIHSRKARSHAVGDWPTMNRSYFRVRVRTSISPYRGSTCYKRRTSPFQNIHIGPRRASKRKDEKSLFTLTYNIPECIMALSIHLFLKKKSSGGGGKKAWGRGRGGTTSPLPLLFPDHPFLPLPPAR